MVNNQNGMPGKNKLKAKIVVIKEKTLKDQIKTIIRR